MDTLTALADEYYDYVISSNPTDLMWGGKLENLDQWTSMTPQASAERCARLAEFEERALALELGDDKAALALRDIIATSARSSIYSEKWAVEVTALNPRMGLVELIFSFVAGFPLRTAEHGRQYIDKLRNMTILLTELSGTARIAADAGRVPLARHLADAATRVEDYLATPAGPDERLCAQPAPTELTEEEQAAWRAERDQLVAGIVRPALREYAASLRRLEKIGRPENKPGLCWLEGGKEVYQDYIWANLLIDKSAEEIHELGLAQIARLEEEYKELGEKVLGITDVDEIYARLRDDESMKFRTPEAVVEAAEKALEKAKAAIPDWFGILPESDCTVEATPYGPVAYYSDPNVETGKQGNVYFNTADPASWATYELESTAFHESIPGHHLQLAITAEKKDLHKVQRDIGNTAFIEGWALYSERLADEMGLFESDLTRFGLLSADSLRACRLVVDTGMHALGWSRERAITFMLEHSPQDREQITQEVDRYIGLPGQALSYMIGRLEILAVREEAQKRGDFDIKAFHDAVLGYGSVPLSTMRRNVLD